MATKQAIDGRQSVRIMAHGANPEVCYVRTFQGPRSVWATWAKGSDSYRTLDHDPDRTAYGQTAALLRRAIEARGIRWGYLRPSRTSLRSFAPHPMRLESAPIAKPADCATGPQDPRRLGRQMPRAPVGTLRGSRGSSFMRDRPESMGRLSWRSQRVSMIRARMRKRAR